MNILKHFLSFAIAVALVLTPTAVLSSPPSMDMRWAIQSAVMVHITGLAPTPVGDFQRIGGGGSGTAIHTVGGKTRVLTAAHVCDLGPAAVFVRATVTTHGRNIMEGRVIALDHSTDLCVIDVKGTIRSIDVANSMPTAGTKCAIVGAPGRRYGPQAWPTHDTLLLNGPTIVPFARSPIKDAVWEVTADLTGGWSGAGVICGGRIAGIVFAVDRHIGELAYIIQVDYLKSFLAKHDARKDWSKK